MPVRDDQRILASALAGVFPQDLVQLEWPAMRDEPGHYSPRVDIAVGPFATHAIYEDEYDAMCSDYHDLLIGMHQAFVENVEEFDGRWPSDLELMFHFNGNARCFMAIEVEGSGSKKHIMGGMVNACALGRFGVSLACSPSELRTLLRVREYMLFLGEVGKNTFNPRNSLILTTGQLAGLLGVGLGV